VFSVSAMLVTKTSQSYRLTDSERSQVKGLFTVQVPGLYMFLLKTCHSSNHNVTVDFMHNSDVMYSGKILVHDGNCVTYPAMGQMSLGDHVSARVALIFSVLVFSSHGNFELDIALMHV